MKFNKDIALLAASALVASRGWSPERAAKEVARIARALAAESKAAEARTWSRDVPF